MKLRKMIRVMKAARHGAPIQHKHRKSKGIWWDTPAPRWDWGFYPYRVARSAG